MQIKQQDKDRFFKKQTLVKSIQQTTKTHFKYITKRNG